MNDVVICTNTMSLSVFRVNVSIAVQVILVGPAACLGGTVGSKNVYLCKPPNHVPRRSGIHSTRKEKKRQ
jgi:hypothetical protein